MECPYCHAREMPGALFCRHCGYPLWEEVAREESQSRPETSPAAPQGTSGSQQACLRTATGEEIPLSGPGPWIVGRTTATSRPDLDAQALGARHVSRRHARLEWRSDGLYVIDLDSTNGTWVNGKRLYPHEPKRLRHGDWIRWADLEVQVVLPASESEAAREDTAS
ncbi:MAG: FHA domain-containing protein [Chloroflexi bacterium]|nr:FHA domain-containing protein [Chloroflexota bacterium]